MKILNRHQAREAAVQFLYQIDINKDSLEDNLANLRDENPDVDLDEEYLMDIIKGAYQNQAEIDEKINQYVTDWKVSRMGKVDLAIIRLAVYELLFRDDIPYAVAINEAVELAKSFSDQKTARFVNGALGKIVDNLDLNGEE